MANKRATNRDIVNISSVLQETARNNADLKKLIATIQKGSRVPRRLEKSLKKANNKDLQKALKQEKQLARLLRSEKALTAEKRKEIEMLEKAHRITLRRIKSQDKILEQNDKYNKSLGRSKSLLSEIISKIKNVVIPTVALGAAIGTVVSLYKTWFDIENKWKKTMGTIAQSTGASAQQFEQYRGIVESMRGTFSELTGDVAGIETSGVFVNELVTSFRNAKQIIPGLTTSILEFSRGFGIGTENATALFRLVTQGSDNAIADFQKFGAEMQKFAEDIGANSGILMKDFAESRNQLAQFGRQSFTVFKNASMLANEYGFEVGKVLSMAAKFDTFEAASENVNQLNAMFGASLSSFELMMEQDPAQRIEMVRRAIKSTGLDWDKMNRFQHMQLAKTLGESEEVLQRIFSEGKSLNDIDKERKKAEAERIANEQRNISNSKMMNNLLMRTQEHMLGIFDYFEQIKIMFSEALGPAFKEFRDLGKEILQRFGDWLKKMTQTREFKRFLEDAKRLMRDVADQIEKVKWEDIKEFASKTWDAMKGMWEAGKGLVSALMPVLKFIADNPGLLVGFFAAPALLKGLGALSSLAGLGKGLGLSAGASGALAGGAIPLAVIVAALGNAIKAESDRVEEGQKFSKGDPATRQRLSESARDELRSRARQFRRGKTDLALNSRDEKGFTGYFTHLKEGLGMLSGQEADLERNDLRNVIDTFVKSGLMNPNTAIRELRSTMSPELIAAFEKQQNKSLNDYVFDVFKKDEHLRENFRQSLGLGPPTSAPEMQVEGSATSSAPVVENTANSSLTSTNSSLPPLEIRPGNVYLDSRKISEYTIEVVQSGRSF